MVDEALKLTSGKKNSDFFVLKHDTNHPAGFAIVEGVNRSDCEWAEVTRTGDRGNRMARTA